MIGSVMNAAIVSGPSRTIVSSSMAAAAAPRRNHEGWGTDRRGRPRTSQDVLLSEQGRARRGERLPFDPEPRAICDRRRDVHDPRTEWLVHAPPLWRARGS